MNIIICRVWDLDEAMLQPVDALVSISDPGDQEPNVQHLGLPVLPLVFHDACERDEGIFHLPQAWHLKQLWAFLDRHQPATLLHCTAGVSRSPGMALAALSWLGYLPDSELVHQVLAVQPLAQPNSRIVRLLDELTGRDVQRALQAALPGWLTEDEECEPD